MPLCILCIVPHNEVSPALLRLQQVLVTGIRMALSPTMQLSHQESAGG